MSQISIFCLSGSVPEPSSGVFPPVSPLSVLLGHLHAAQTAPVHPGSGPELPPSLPAAAPGRTLVHHQHLRLPASDLPPRIPVPAAHGPGARSCGCFTFCAAHEKRWRRHQWQTVVPGKETGEASSRSPRFQAEDVCSYIYSARLSRAFKWWLVFLL